MAVSIPMPIDTQAWPSLFEAVYEMNSAATNDDFASAVVAGMSRLIPADVVHFQVLDRVSGRFLSRMDPPNLSTPEEIAYYTANSEKMPLVAYYARTGDTAARRISDVIGMREWLEGDYYRNCLQRLDLPYSLGLPVSVGASIVVGLSFSRRGVDFSLQDCELLDAFAPHFRQAWQRQENPWKDASEAERAARCCFGKLGLSPREGEVLYWMTEGKQNREIAVILGIRLGTVQEYVAAILAKLGQENRHAATVHAIGMLDRR